MVYIHSGCTRSRGALKVFKDHFDRFPLELRVKLRRSYIVQPSVFLKLRVFFKTKVLTLQEGTNFNIKKFDK